MARILPASAAAVKPWARGSQDGPDSPELPTGRAAEGLGLDPPLAEADPESVPIEILDGESRIP